MRRASEGMHRRGEGDTSLRGTAPRASIAPDERGLSRWLLVTSLLLVLAPGAGCPSATAGNAIADEVAESVRDHGPRVTVVLAIEQIDEALGLGRAAAAAEKLAAVWPVGGQLADDRALRALLRALPAAEVPSSLSGARAVEDAQAALEEGRPEVARSVLNRVPWATDDTSVTGLRAAITLALATLGPDPMGSRSRLARVANGRYDDAARQELAALARLTLAGSWLDDGDFKEAIAEFLRVDATSGYWRQARFGLASCQLRAGRPESALKVLALLPGGLVAEPERALVAAVAAHAIGRPEDAVAVVDAALARRALWRDEPDTVLEVELEAARLDAGGRAPDDDTLVTVTAAVPAVRAALREVAAARAERAAATGADTLVLARWERQAARVAAGVVVRELAARTRAAAERFEDLETLRPQLR